MPSPGLNGTTGKVGSLSPQQYTYNKTPPPAYLEEGTAGYSFRNGQRRESKAQYQAPL